MQANLNVGKAIAELDKQMQKNLAKSAYHLQKRMRENVNTAQPYEIRGGYYKGLNPSQPGKFPHKVRGDLQRSYQAVQYKDFWQIGTSSKVGGWMETGTVKMARRPVVMPTVQQETEALKVIMREGFN